MSRPKWSRYLRDSLLIHVVVFLLLGGVAYQHLQPAGQAPIKVQVVLSGTGTSGGRNAGAGKSTPAAAASAKSPAPAAPAVPAVEQEPSSRPVVSQPEAPGAEPVTDTGKALETPGITTTTGTLAPGSREGVSNGNGSTGSAGDTGSSGEEGQGTGAGDSGDGNGSSGNGSGTEDLSEPAVLTRYAKLYPRAARNAGEEGSVLVGVTVSAGGSVTEAYLAESSGYDRLDRAAVKSAYNWRFSPAKNTAGNAIESTAMIRVHYSLND